GAKCKIGRPRILLDVFATLGPRNGNDERLFRKEKSESEHRRRYMALGRDLVDLPHQIEILLKIVAHESGRKTAIIVFVEVFETGDLPGQKASTERAIGEKTDSELAATFEHAIDLRLARPKRILGLNRSNRVDRVRLLKRLSVHL